jgi:hypothetical protein
MTVPTLALGLIVHPQDAPLLPEFLARHAGHFEAVCVVIDSDNASAAEVNGLAAMVRDHFAPCPDRLHLAVRPLQRDFAGQRNHCAALNPCDWLLMLDADERIRARSLKLLRPALVELLGRYPQVRVLGLARDNSLDGRTLKTGQDWQYRLVRSTVRWRNTAPELDATPGCHELPQELHDAPEVVMALEHLVIIHEKTRARQLAQNRFYKDCA